MDFNSFRIVDTILFFVCFETIWVHFRFSFWVNHIGEIDTILVRTAAQLARRMFCLNWIQVDDWDQNSWLAGKIASTLGKFRKTFFINIGAIFLLRFRLYVLSFMFRFMFANICFEKNQNIKIHVMFITKHNMKWNMKNQVLPSASYVMLSININHNMGFFHG